MATRRAILRSICRDYDEAQFIAYRASDDPEMYFDFQKSFTSSPILNFLHPFSGVQDLTINLWHIKESLRDPEPQELIALVKSMVGSFHQLTKVSVVLGGEMQIQPDDDNLLCLRA